MRRARSPPARAGGTALEVLIRELVGREPAITHRWSGSLLGLACGDLVAKAIIGRREPELELFDLARLL